MLHAVQTQACRSKQLTHALICAACSTLLQLLTSVLMCAVPLSSSGIRPPLKVIGRMSVRVLVHVPRADRCNPGGIRAVETLLRQPGALTCTLADVRQSATAACMKGNQAAYNAGCAKEHNKHAARARMEEAAAAKAAAQVQPGPQPEPEDVTTQQASDQAVGGSQAQQAASQGTSVANQPTAQPEVPTPQQEPDLLHMNNFPDPDCYAWWVSWCNIPYLAVPTTASESVFCAGQAAPVVARAVSKHTTSVFPSGRWLLQSGISVCWPQKLSM